ncbi:FGGY-family carbohydrate kinase, partial [Cognatishimia sp.]|uniref:FGGY-family carbohydrate kinase n=1 Tax=Cognatishimia sp. TaxID=2211648 RepID=UPI003515CE80
QATGTDLASLVTTGGGTRSPFWLQTLANVLGIPLHVPAKGEFGAAMGAARLAMAAHSGEDPAQVMTKPEMSRTVEPNSALQDQYQAKYEQFVALYPAVTSAMTPK